MSSCLIDAQGGFTCRRRPAAAARETYVAEPNRIVAVRVITLPSRRDRVVGLLQELADVAPSREIVPAVTGDAVPEGVAAPHLRPGERGCIASHLATLRAWLDDGAARGDGDWVLVLEDDVVLSRAADATELIAATMRELPATADFVYFGRCHDDCSKYRRVSRHVMHALAGAYCTHAYAVNRAGCRRLLEHAKMPVDSPIDFVYANAHGASGTAYAAPRSVFFQDRAGVPTAIGNHDALRECEFDDA